MSRRIGCINGGIIAQPVPKGNLHTIMDLTLRTNNMKDSKNMSRKRKNFSAKFKSDLVLEVLKGEKELNVIATENGIQPNLLRNWKKEFLEKASVVFDDTREENIKEKLSEERKEKAAYAKKVGQLTMQVDWLKKSEEMLGPDYESQFSPKAPFDD